MAGETNPAAGIGKLSGGDGWGAWQMDDIAYARQHLRPDLCTRPRSPFILGSGGGDVLKMQWGAIRDGQITVRRGRTGKPLAIPLHRDLVTILGQIEKSSIRILVDSRGKPWATGFPSAWQDAMNAEAFTDFRSDAWCFTDCARAPSISCWRPARPCRRRRLSPDDRTRWWRTMGVDYGKLESAVILKWEGKNGA